MGWKVLLILFVLSASLVSGELFFFYDEDVFTVKRIFNPRLHEAVFSPFLDLKFDVKETEKAIVENKLEEKIVEIIITEKGFIPDKIEVTVDQEVVWKNERIRLPTLLMGVREISAMKSNLKPGESFNYSFSEPGKYTYVDGIVIGVMGEVVVR